MLARRTRLARERHDFLVVAFIYPSLPPGLFCFRLPVDFRKWLICTPALGSRFVRTSDTSGFNPGYLGRRPDLQGSYISFLTHGRALIFCFFRAPPAYFLCLLVYSDVASRNQWFFSVLLFQLMTCFFTTVANLNQTLSVSRTPVQNITRSGVPLTCLCCWIELLRAFEIRYEIRCLRTFLLLIWCVYLWLCKIICVFLEHVFKLSNCYNICLAQIHGKIRISRTRVCITKRRVSHVFLTKCMLQKNRRISRTRVQKKVPTNSWQP